MSSDLGFDMDYVCDSPASSRASTPPMDCSHTESLTHDDVPSPDTPLSAALSIMQRGSRRSSEASCTSSPLMRRKRSGSRRSSGESFSDFGPPTPRLISPTVGTVEFLRKEQRSGSVQSGRSHGSQDSEHWIPPPEFDDRDPSVRPKFYRGQPHPGDSFEGELPPPLPSQFIEDEELPQPLPSQHISDAEPLEDVPSPPVPKAFSNDPPTPEPGHTEAGPKKGPSKSLPRQDSFDEAPSRSGSLTADTPHPVAGTSPKLAGNDSTPPLKPPTPQPSPVPSTSSRRTSSVQTPSIGSPSSPQATSTPAPSIHHRESKQRSKSSQRSKSEDSALLSPEPDSSEGQRKKISKSTNYRRKYSAPPSTSSPGQSLPSPNMRSSVSSASENALDSPAGNGERFGFGRGRRGRKRSSAVSFRQVPTIVRH